MRRMFGKQREVPFLKATVALGVKLMGINSNDCFPGVWYIYLHEWLKFMENVGSRQVLFCFAGLLFKPSPQNNNNVFK